MIYGILMCETVFKCTWKFAEANNVNEFKEIGLKIMPDATRIAVEIGKEIYVLLNGQKFDRSIFEVFK